MAVKSRKIHSIGGFRGLDKENKPLKVKDFRAVDGENFIIESETIKTRKAVQPILELPFSFYDGEFLIDWYFYNEMNIYITNKHIRIQDGDLLLNELDSDGSQFIFSGSLIEDLSNSKPLFKEEKDCLFIFCIGNIYVFSRIEKEDESYLYVLYELNRKPNNPFNPLIEEDHKKFEDLPIPYEPTVFIQDNRLDDVNLLSNVTKYKLFSSSEDAGEGGYINFKLPTIYNEENHLSFDLDLEMYKGIFDVTDCIPIFIGRENEDFESLGDFGALLNDGDPIKLQSTFYPLEDWEYKATDDGTTRTITSTVSEKLKLNKEDFFNFVIEGSKTNRTVFDYLVDYINVNSSSFTLNKVLIFELKVTVNTSYREETTDNIIAKEVEDKTVNVYVQLKKNEEEITTFEETHFETNYVKEYVLENPYPSVPSYTQPTVVAPLVNHQYQLNSGNPLLLNDISDQKIRDLSRVVFENIPNLFQDGENISVTGTVYNEKQDLVREFYDAESSYKWTISDYIILGSTDTIPHISLWGLPPTFNNPDGLQVIQANPFLIPNSYAQEYDYMYEDLIEDMKDDITENSGDVFVRIPVLYVYGGTSYYGKWVILKCSFDKGIPVDYSERKSFVIDFSVVVDSESVVNDMFNYSFDEERNVINLNIKDYFVDYRNEPSIDVKITFQNNPDYKKISNSKFGISFGAENRLFLAGNEEHKNIDRYNISNDLLGDNVKNQSYELTYFPSKNYRVVGGKGAINGYVVATDTRLYITKEEYRNDNKFFIRERQENDGVVQYFETKTNINKTPLNERCIVSFNNDIIMLAKDGLYAIEISSNVLTNERLLKLRNGFIRKAMNEEVAKVDPKSVYILENNISMYIFVGDNVFYADARYVDTNENSPIENLSYEIVQWKMNNNYPYGRIVESELQIIDEEGKAIYGLIASDEDQKFNRYKNELAIHETHDGLYLSSAYDYIFDEPEKYRFKIPNSYKKIAIETTDYTFNGTDTISIINDSENFVSINDGDTIYFKDGSTFYPMTVSGFVDSVGQTISVSGDVGTDFSSLYINVENEYLYIDFIYQEGTDYYFRLSKLKPSTITKYVYDDTAETLVEFYARVELQKKYTNDLVFDVVDALKDFSLKYSETIILRFLTNITSFGNDLMEKTIFKTFLYATRQDRTSTIKLGYKTIGRVAGLNDQETYLVPKVIDMQISNDFSFEYFDFNMFSVNTFNEYGTSFPMKESNFLYIQFVIIGLGMVEINKIQFLYKNNRVLKSVG